MTDGDGTVPLVSLGGMCRGSWREAGSPLNPSGIPVVTREYRNELDLSSNSTAPGRFNWVNPFHHIEKLRRFKRSAFVATQAEISGRKSSVQLARML